MNITSVQLDPHFPEVTSEQLLPFTHCAQVLSGLTQFSSQEKPDEFRLHV